MRRKQHRHPALETAVFAAALLLSAFIARELWRRRASAQEVEAPMKAVEIHATHPDYAAPSRGRTEQAVMNVPPIKLTRVQPRGPKPRVPPVPQQP